MKPIQNLIILICLLIPLTAPADERRKDPLSSLPKVSREHVRLGEGVAYCHAGYGTQQMTFKIAGQSVHSDTVSNPYLPGFDPTQSTFLRFGCKTDRFFVDFSTTEGSMRLNKEITVSNEAYNTIQYQYRSITAGHSLSLVRHRLYLDLGMGYRILDYRLGRYGNRYANEDESDTKSAGGLLLRTGIRVIINHYVMIDWQHEKSINDESVVDYAGQLGLNFISRF